MVSPGQHGDGVVGDLTIPRAFPHRFLFNQGSGLHRCGLAASLEDTGLGTTHWRAGADRAQGSPPCAAASTSPALHAASLVLCTHVCTHTTDMHPF